MTTKQSVRLHCDPFALSLSKGKRRPFILRQAQDERTQDTGECRSRLLRRAPHSASHLRTPRNDTVWTFSTVPKRGDSLERRNRSQGSLLPLTLGRQKNTEFLPKKVLRLIINLLYLIVLTAVCIEREDLRATAITLRADQAWLNTHSLDATYVLRTF